MPKAFPVGSFNIGTTSTNGDQAFGPTRDGRTAPYVQAPTSGDIASSAPNSLWSPGGTSFSGPYVAAAMMMLRDLYIPNKFDATPGGLYASILAMGRYFDPPFFDNQVGAGRLWLPTFCTDMRVGWVDVPAGGSVLLPTDGLDSGYKWLRVAVWWPEEPGQVLDFDLEMQDGSGSIVASSSSPADVFERVEAFPQPDAVTIKVAGTAGSGTHRVYFALVEQCDERPPL